MGSRIALVGTVLLMGLSAGIAAFFIAMVDPEYLNFSGYFVFYCSLFIFAWCFFYLLIRFLGRFKRFFQLFSKDAGKHALLLAFAAITYVLFSQMRVVAWFTIAPIAAVALFAEYILITKRR